MFLINKNQVAYSIDNEIKFYKLDSQGQINEVGSFKYTKVLDFIWTTHTTIKKSSKGEKQSSQDVLLVNTGDELILLSPMGEVRKLKSNNIDKLVGYKNDTIWALKNSKLMMDNKEVNAKFEKAYLQDDQIIGTTKDQIVIGKVSGNKFVCENQYQISNVRQILKYKNSFVALNDKVHIIKDEIEVLDCEDVKSVQLIDENLVVIEAGAIKFFESDKFTHSLKENVDGIVANGKDKYIFWKGKNLKFKKIDPSIKNHSSVEDQIVIEVPIEEINNFEPEIILEKLNLSNKSDTIELCSSQNNQDTIKAVIKSLSSQQAQELYSIIVKEIKTSININYWIKWICLIHGNSISLEDSKLDDSVKLLPHILSIQGKLELLKIQSNMRKNDQNFDITTTNDDLVYINGEIN